MTRSLLTVLGDLVEDIVVWPAGPWRAATDNPASIARSRGGSAANVAVVAAAAGVSGVSGVATRFVGRVGDDDTGRRLVAGLGSAGVDVRVQVGAGSTGTIVVVVEPDGERTMFNDRGVAAGLERIDDEWLAGTTVLHVPAYAFDPPSARTVVIEAAARVRAGGGAVSVDVSAESLVDAIGAETFRSLLDEMAPTWVFANRTEADALGLAPGPGPGHGPGGAGPSGGPPPWGWPPPGRHHVVKDGPRPAVVLSGTSPGADPTRLEVPAPIVADVRDTTGAGDAFAAGFLRAVMAGADLEAACHAAHRTAATVLTTPGASPTTIPGPTPGATPPPPTDR
ncbi:MAG: PfkB family carbohydrate kinase [Ilumatobacteraceae bacterium]